jgi:sugar phosphate isomerase/epimerase
MSLLTQQSPFFAHPHLTGSLWPEPPRDSFKDRVAAVASVGSPGMGMSADELNKLMTESSAYELRGILDYHGVQIGELELLLGWMAPADTEHGAQARATEELMYKLAGIFGCTRIKTAAAFPPPMELPPTEYLAQCFAEICDRSAEHGIVVQLEPFAVFPGFNYSVAADVVLMADRPNGGLLIDAWHYFRDPHGPEGMEKVSGRQITGVELCDGYAEPRGTLQEDCLDHRLLPGEGAFDLVGLMKTLEAKGVDVPLSVEILSAAMREKSPQEVVTATTDAVRSLLEATRAS